MKAGFDALAATIVGLVAFGLYVLTLAPTALRSDSGEFHVVPWVLGIAHAPGYPLLTLLGRLAMFLPIGDPAYRVNLLDAAAAAAAVGCVYLVVVELAGPQGGRVGGLAAAAALGLGATYWQQAVVGGPRPFIFFFTALLLWLAFRWGSGRGASDLVVLAGAAGLALAHHPNLLMLFPGLALYLLGRDPRLPLRFRQVGPAAIAFGLPLLLYLYLPLRSAMEPPLGAQGLLDARELAIYVTASHYQDTVLNNCGGSRLVQAQRYGALFMLQFGPLLALASALGAALTLVRAPLAGLTLLYAFLSNSIFGICSSLAMPDYVIPSYLVAACWLGLGPAWLLDWLAERLARPWPRVGAATALAGIVLGLGAYRLATGLPYQDMAGRTLDADRARRGLAQSRADGLVLSDWESITPLWYAQHVHDLNRRLKTAMITAAPGSDTWLIETEKGLEARPVALAQRVPSLGDHYRLFPVGSLYEVTPKPVQERGGFGLLSDDRALRLLGYHLDPPTASPGELVRLTLYQKTDRGRDVGYLPVLRVGSEPPVEFRFDGSLHYPLPTWADGEVVGEVYEFSVPAWVAPGELPLELAYRIEGRDGLVGLAGSHSWTDFGTLQVVAPTAPRLPEPPGSLANFANQLVLRDGKLGGASADLAAAPAGAQLRPGATLELEGRWSALRWLDDSYTLFIHLLDDRSRLVAQQDALPLGGVFHTYKWVPGQVITDWYRLPLPADLPPGEYWLEVGAYQSVTTRRLPLLDARGGSDRTSFRWGPIRIE